MDPNGYGFHMGHMKGSVQCLTIWITFKPWYDSCYIKSYYCTENNSYSTVLVKKVLTTSKFSISESVNSANLWILNNFWENLGKFRTYFFEYRSEWKWNVKFMRNYGCRTQKYLYNWVKCPVKYLNEGESIWQSVEQGTQILIFWSF